MFRISIIYKDFISKSINQSDQNHGIEYQQGRFVEKSDFDNIGLGRRVHLVTPEKPYWLIQALRIKLDRRNCLGSIDGYAKIRSHVTTRINHAELVIIRNIKRSLKDFLRSGLRKLAPFWMWRESCYLAIY